MRGGTGGSIGQEIFSFLQRLSQAGLFVQDGSLALQSAFRLGGNDIGFLWRPIG